MRCCLAGGGTSTQVEDREAHGICMDDELIEDAGSGNTDHVHTQHARIYAPDKNAARVRAASICESVEDGGCAALQQSPGISGM